MTGQQRQLLKMIHLMLLRLKKWLAHEVFLLTLIQDRQLKRKSPSEGKQQWYIEEDSVGKRPNQTVPIFLGRNSLYSSRGQNHAEGKYL
jgi:hypothetical protein